MTALGYVRRSKDPAGTPSLLEDQRARIECEPISQNGQTTNFAEVSMAVVMSAVDQICRDFVAPTALPKSRLHHLVHAVARLYRRDHITADEARYIHKRVRRLLGLCGRPTRSKRLPEILSPDELRLILAQAYQDRGLYGLIARTLFETGLRVSELVRVQVPDVDFTERVIRVREGKGGRDRLVLFTEDLGQQLRLHLGHRTRGALFESNRSAPFTTRRIQQIVKAVARRAGVAKTIHPHTYRHSMATFLRNQGVPLDVVQLLLGHADPRTTQIYTRLSLATVRGEYDRAMARAAR